MHVILKNHMQKKLVIIIGEHQSEVIKKLTLIYTLSTICVIIDESNKVNKNLSVISLELILFFLLCISSDMETNSFTFQVACTNIESKIKIHGLQSDPLIPMCARQWCQLSKLLYNIPAEVLANLINADKRIKE